MEEDEALERSIERIVCSIREQKHDDVETLCSSTVRLFANCKLLKSIEEDVERQLQAIFGDSYCDVSLAVRSSAADEDGNEISSAGQMETFLGVRGLDKIPEAVRKCWASAFTYQAVEYRRQHGQSIRPSVGVVIQEMVQSDTAGVIFTNDPVTGNVNTMVIDASFGLGESIVSGQASPDTVIIRRYFDGTVEIQERSLGHKNVRIDVADAGGTCRVETDSMIQQCCISDEQILQLCRIAIKVEDYFGSSRDIEWSIKGNTVYLLQARPITTTAHETDDSFIHEFDSPSATDRQYVTTANVGEMLPGCVTPLTGSVFQTATDWACRVFAGEIVGGIRKNFTTRKMLLSNCGRLFVNSTYSSSVNSNNPLFDKEGLEINFYGEIVSEHTMEIIKSYGHINKSKLSNWYNLVKFVFNTNLHGCPMVDYWYDKLLTYEIGSHCQTAEDLYTEIDRKFPDYKEAWLATLHTTGKSIFWTSLAIGVISKGEKVYNPDFYSDIALLLAQCKDVFSAEVPTDLQKIASKIAEYGIDEDFLNKTDKECVVYLTSSTCNDELKQAYKTFMDRHGHRCVREAELIEKSWRAEPETLIKALKAILKSKSYKVSNKNNPSLDESLDQMKTPVSKIGKFFLKKLIIPHARDAVGRREYGKSVAIDMCDKFKQAYWRLADMLVKECRIPDRELMFFLTHTEIGQLLDTRSANLITRAKRRRKVLPMQSEIEFPKLNVGRPQPISSEMVCDQRKASFTVHGVPVSHGLIQGTARVVRTLEEADAIQKGDILIVPYTDVGWSPYFPLITGLLTEMGGLCSHGAVVAREYGLPCLVNIPRATKLFQSGDLIRLNGTTGLVEKLEHSTNQI